MECKRKENIKCSSFPSHAPIRHTSDPLVSISFPLGSYACVSVRELLHPTGYISIPSGRKAEDNGFPLDSILGGKGGNVLLLFFSLSCLFPTGSTGETQDGSLGTRDKGYCCLLLFPSSAFFGSEAPDPPLGERGGQKGE